MSRQQVSCQWGAYPFSSFFILDVATSQKDHKLFSATNNLCSKKIGIEKIAPHFINILKVAISKCFVQLVLVLHLAVLFGVTVTYIE